MSAPESQITVLRGQLERSQADLQTARRVIEVQGNVSAIADIEPLVGTLAACRALGASRAGLYRRRSPAPVRARRPRPSPARALSDQERAAVLEQLNSPRFVNASPAEVYATLLDEGRYLAS